MTDLEQAGRAPSGEQLVAGARSRGRVRRRRTWTAALTAAAAVTGLVVGLAVVLPDQEVAPTAEPTPSPSPSSSLPVVPPGLQAVSWRGVEVLVPDTWHIGAEHCGTPLEDTVLIQDGGPMLACIATGPEGLTVVRLGPTADAATVPPGFTEVLVNGLPAWRGTYSSDPRLPQRPTLRFPVQGVAVSVESPDPSFAEQLLDQVRVTPVDSRGCPDRVPALVPETPEAPADELVPGTPATAAICRYSDLRLAESAALGSAGTATLAGILNALPPGTSQPAGAYFQPAETCPEELRRGFVVQFADADGSRSVVSVRIGGCADLSASNGVRTTKITEELRRFLRQRAGYDGAHGTRALVTRQDGRMHLTELQTPALLVDEGALEHNLRTMADHLPGNRLRPHVKAHKTTELARRQQGQGHPGFTCATIREVEGMAAAGMGEDLLLANEVLDARRLGRVTEQGARVTVAVDSPETVDAAAAGGVWEVVIDVEVGLPRCGVAPGGAGRLADLARGKGLAVRGVMGYEGHLMMEPPDKRREGVEAAMALLLRAAQDVGGDLVSAGGTGTYAVNTWAGEIQAGSYALMDTAYGTLELPFRQALTVLGRVVSVSSRGWAVADVGLKALGMDHGNPTIDGATVWFCSDEHITFSTETTTRVGDLVRVVPAHVDPTVAQHERMHLVAADGEVSETWPVDLRGW